MRVNLLNLRALRLVVVAGFASILVSCGSGTGSSETEDSLSVDNDKIQKEKIVKETKKVMFSLPSPIETSMLIKRAGAQYNEELLNPV